jgi:hypothetical protein
MKKYRVYNSSTCFVLEIGYRRNGTSQVLIKININDMIFNLIRIFDGINPALKNSNIDVCPFEISNHLSGKKRLKL